MSENSVKELLQLSEAEARVLGSLMEKQLTTPETYPLTLNALVTACNQKTSREPVTHYSSGEVQQVVNSLRDRDLIEVEYGSRADRFNQRLSKHLYLDKPQQALLTIMLLRGPQTVGDLFARTQRMAAFDSTESVSTQLEILCQKVTPFLIQIPRQSGQREDRYMHLLCGDVDADSFVETAPVVKAASPSTVALEERIALLEAQVEKLLAHTGLGSK